jgi:hypothetical protein
MRYIVTLDGVPCARVVEKRFGKALSPLRGILIQRPIPEVFRGKASADRAIKFTLRARAALSNSVCDMPPAIKPYLDGTTFAVKEHGRSV